MPRYFFNVHDSTLSLDDTGVECADVAAARMQAVETAGAMVRDLGRHFWTGEHWRMWVTDEGGTTVCALRFSSELARNVLVRPSVPRTRSRDARRRSSVCPTR